MSRLSQTSVAAGLMAAAESLQSVLVVGSNLRKDHPLLAQRIRQAVRKGGQVASLNDRASDWAMPVAHNLIAPASAWVQQLADVAAAVVPRFGVEVTALRRRRLPI